MLIKEIVSLFVNTMTLDDLRLFKYNVLIPQNAKCLIEHVDAAEDILRSKESKE